VTSRTKTVVGIGTALVVLVTGFVVFRMLTKAEGEPLIDLPLVGDDAPACPLTGLEAEDEGNLERRVLAVKIENSPEARPQAGLAEADVVYEQEAEGGITRFIVLYHCQDSDRIGPIRSGRPVDPVVLRQYGEPLFVHSGSVDAVTREVEDAGIEVINCNFEEETCPRDDSREMPHDIFTSTDALRDFSDTQGTQPEAVFTFDADEPEGGKRGREVHLNFSPVSDVFWRYRNNKDVYLRFHGEEPHRLEDGSQIGTALVQHGPPLGRWRLYTQSEEREAGNGQHERSHLQTGKHHHGRDLAARRLDLDRLLGHLTPWDSAGGRGSSRIASPADRWRP
jgi:hypothetical protein